MNGFYSDRRSSNHVAIVEDDPAMQVVLAKLARKAGLIPHTASSAQELVAILSTEAIAMVVLDICLPRVSGLQLRGILESTGAGRLPVLFVTANAEEPEVEQWVQRGTRLIRKPFMIDEVLQALQQMAAEASPADH